MLFLYRDRSKRTSESRMSCDNLMNPFEYLLNLCLNMYSDAARLGAAARAAPRRAAGPRGAAAGEPRRSATLRTAPYRSGLARTTLAQAAADSDFMLQ